MRARKRSCGCLGMRTHGQRPANTYHREDSNLSHRSSQNRVPSSGRWQKRSPRGSNPASSRRSQGNRTLARADMSRVGALHGLRNTGLWQGISCGPLVSAAGIAPAFPVRETGVLPAVRHGHDRHCGTGWIRTSALPINKRSLNHLSFGPKYRRVATPAAVAGAAPSLERAGHYARAKSAMTGGVAGSKPTTSSIPASSGSAMLNPFDVIPTTTSLAGIPRASRYARRA